MPDPVARRPGAVRRFDPARVRVDPARLAAYRRGRAVQAGRLLGRTTPYDLKLPWLTLRADAPSVPGKGWIGFTSPSFVGMGQFETGEAMFAAFDLLFEKEEGSSYSIERPQVTISLQSPPAATMLCEIDLHAHDWAAGDPQFEIQGVNRQTMAVPEGHRETIMVLMRDFLSIRSAWIDGQKLSDRDGNWAFFEARITPID
jgi:hypothetical protein